MVRHVLRTVLLLACCLACESAFTQKREQGTVVKPPSIEIDPSVLGFEAAPDATFIKALHDRSESALLANLGIKTDDTGLTTERFSRKKLAFHSAYELGGEKRRVFVYDPWFHSFPGFQPETIIICDASYRVLAWKEVGGSPALEAAALDQTAMPGPVLLLTRLHRRTIPNPARGVYSFSLAADKIEQLPEIKWLYKDDAERARYDEWRKVLRERENKSNSGRVEQRHSS